MSIPKKLAKVIQKLYRQLLKISRTLTKRVMTWLLRRLMVLRHRSGLAGAGFILPTVTMVILVVILLTTAIVFRSFDRAKNARNYRVSEEVMAAAAPAMDRATAKLDALFDDPRLPRGTPSDSALDNLFEYKDDYNSEPEKDKFTFPDEQRLKVGYDLNDDGNIEEAAARLEQEEAVSTAWRFPVDTDGDGKFDSFTIYFISYRSPLRGGDGSFATARSPLDARTPPMDEGAGSGACAGALKTSAKLVSQAGWYKSGSKLKKSFFVYTATVPIVENLNNLGIAGFNEPPYNDQENYEYFPPGTAPGFSALEYQQDRARIPLSNNAVVFQDDLAVVGGETLRLNGRMVTNGNLFTTTTQDRGNIELYQVSAPASCFYPDVENSKITVGGHVVNAAPLSDIANGRPVKVHLFVEGDDPDIKDLTTTNQSATNSEVPRTILYNSDAYTARVRHLVTRWIDQNPNVNNSTDPEDVKTQVRDAADSEKEKVREKALTAYFRDRTRRVPFEEVPKDKKTQLQDPVGEGDQLRPPDEWMFPYDPEDGKTTSGYAPVSLNTQGESALPKATLPEVLEDSDRENEVGDRMLIGHNLPAVWYEDENPVGENARQEIEGTTWDVPDDTSETRSRASQVTPLSDVGDKGRDGFWEKAAAREPENLLDPVGGLRIVTGAGVYERKNSFLPPPTWDDPTTDTVEAKFQQETVGGKEVITTYYDDPSTSVKETFPIVWPDTMPMSPMAGEKVYANIDSDWVPDPWKGLGWQDGNGQGLPPLTGSPFPNLSAAEFTAIGGTNLIDPNTRKYAKGDLRMRATAVYHYADDRYQLPEEGDDQKQEPIACVSSYYDPTNATTARNPQGLPDVSGQLDWPPTQPGVGWGKSNNGVSYPAPPSQTSKTVSKMTRDAQGLVGGQGKEDYGNIQQKLAYQANLVFPNGRFVNEPLRDALLAEPDERTLAQQAAIDSSICALQILDGTLQPNESVIPHGAISEVAFLDSRQIQAIHKDDPDTLKVESVADFIDANDVIDYDLPIEERQPLEVRATKIDLDKLRKKGISGSFIPESVDEYLLPNSGIIYASRDDALPDLSQLLPELPDKEDYQLPGDELDEEEIAGALRTSAVDYKLDPTRRPSGILIFNGEKLARNNTENFREEEKGLTLVTDLPAYLWAWSDQNEDGIVDDGDESLFNPHTQEEFNAELNAANWNNFYGRGQDEDDLNPDFACRPGDERLDCQTGDTWRPATVIADSMTLLSKDFRFGFRDEGDYDLRNNHVVNQSFITNRLNNGFFANDFVTNGFSSGGITIDGKTPTEEDYSQNGNQGGDYVGSSYFNNFVTPVQRRFNGSAEYIMEICRKLPVSACTAEDWVVGYDRNGDGVLTTDPDPTLDEKNVTVDQLGALLVTSKSVGINTPVGAGRAAGGDNQLQHNEADWFDPYVATIGGSAGSNLSPRDRLGAGTTAEPALMEADRRFPRRIAFARTKNHTLILDDARNNTVRPIGVGCTLDTTGDAPENNGCVYGGVANNLNVPNRNTQNNLWFRNTVSGTVGGKVTDPGDPTRIDYQVDRPIYYETNVDKYAWMLDKDGAPQRKYVNDGTDFKVFVPKVAEDPAYGAIAAELARLNLDNDPVAKYPFCLAKGCSVAKNMIDDSDTVAAAALTPLSGAKFRINKVREALMPAALNPATPGDAIVEPEGDLLATGGTLTAQPSEDATSTNLQKSVNVYDLTVGTFNDGATITLQGTPESIFVLRRTDGALTFGNSSGNGVQLNLEGGVDPNNIYWVVENGNLTFNTPSGDPHLLAGNFIGNSANTITFNDVDIIGGRFLGFNNVAAFGTNVKIYAMTAQDQPITVPVLQLQIPKEDNGNINPSGNIDEEVERTNWHQKATPSTFNLISAAGNTPAREGEPDGGVGNFARLLEDWADQTLTISGSLMQFDRSSYATSPYQPFLEIGPFWESPGGLFEYTQKYSTRNSQGKLPYSQPQKRRVGYDVGLLSQLPDLFSSQFTTPPTGAPDEFYREVSRNDPWLQALLCAKTVDGNNAVSDKERPSCPW
ncbi:MAG: hormogonium polysaccharide biosynthesis protein HpsA [Coleofasciculus sp. C1-SOL-03]|uniref:hormogonium polysaccharide biosynthesis protein HpsA n=1 Tax=Coleofasciculus sp. C1-SOL-03 TaxID=3069522 RepID=UPI0033015E27